MSEAAKPSAMPTIIFGKPNEHNEAYFNSAMARKRRMKSNSDVPTLRYTILPRAYTMGEYRSTSKVCRDEIISKAKNGGCTNLVMVHPRFRNVWVLKTRVYHPR